MLVCVVEVTLALTSYFDIHTWVPGAVEESNVARPSRGLLLSHEKERRSDTGCKAQEVSPKRPGVVILFIQHVQNRQIRREGEQTGGCQGLWGGVL